MIDPKNRAGFLAIDLGIFSDAAYSRSGLAK